MKRLEPVLSTSISPTLLRKKAVRPVQCYNLDFEDEKVDDVPPRNISPINLNKKGPGPVECYDADFDLGDEDALDHMDVPSLITPAKITHLDSGLQVQNHSEFITQTDDVPMTPVTVIQEPSTPAAIEMDDKECTKEDIEAAFSVANYANVSKPIFVLSNDVNSTQKALDESLEANHGVVMGADAADDGWITEAVPYENPINDFLQTVRNFMSFNRDICLTNFQIKNSGAAVLAEEAASKPEPLPEVEPEKISEPVRKTEPVPETSKEMLSIHVCCLFLKFIHWRH